MPQITGVIERVPWTYWDAYIDDYRFPDQANPTPVPFSTQTMFFQNHTDPRRTNCASPYGMVGERTFRLQEVGLRLFFTDESLYQIALTGLEFRLYVGDLPAFTWDAGIHVGVDPFAYPADDPLVAEEIGIVVDGCDLKNKGFCSFVELPRQIAIPERQRAYIVASCSEALRRKLQEHGAAKELGSYAEIRLYVRGLKTREIT
jgi:hypothetical protein